MTDRERIAQARGLLAEIAHALGCAELGLSLGPILGRELRETSLIAAMLAADGVVTALGKGGHGHGCTSSARP